MKKDLLTKMIIVGAVGLAGIIFTIGVLWALSGGGETTKKTTPTKVDHTIPEDVSENELAFQVDSLNGEKTMALVRKEATEDGVLPVFDIEKKKDILLKIKGETKIKSAYGETISISQIRAGQIIEAKFEPESFATYTLQVSGKAWEKNNPNSFIISAEQNKVKIGLDDYTFDPSLIMVSKGGQPILLENISKSDEVVLRGYRKEVWSIEVIAGHGFVVLKNSDAFVGGTIEIGNRDIRTIEKDMRIETSAGVKKVIITKDDMNPYMNDVFIEEGKEVVIDLGEFKPKVGKVLFSTVQQGVSLFINEEKQAVSNGEVSLDFGQYKLRAEKEGFIPWESVLTVNQVQMQVKIDMKIEPQYLEVQTPVGADLYIDGARIGTIPSRTAITPGEHTITIRREGYYSKNQTIRVENNGKNVNYAFPDLIRIGSNEAETPNNGLAPTAPNVTNPPTQTPPEKPNPNLNPTDDNY